MKEDLDLFSEKDKNTTDFAFTWWEKRRLMYNLIVGVLGILCLVSYGMMTINIIGWLNILFFGISLNAFYFFGFGTEMLLKKYFKADIDFAGLRSVLFWSGTILSVFLVLGISFLAEFL